MKCPFCGANNSNLEERCTYCGASLHQTKKPDFETEVSTNQDNSLNENLPDGAYIVSKNDRSLPENTLRGLTITAFIILLFAPIISLIIALVLQNRIKEIRRSKRETSVNLRNFEISSIVLIVLSSIFAFFEYFFWI